MTAVRSELFGWEDIKPQIFPTLFYSILTRALCGGNSALINMELAYCRHILNITTGTRKEQL